MIQTASEEAIYHMTQSLVRQRYTVWSEMIAERFQMKSMTGMDMPDF